MKSSLLAKLLTILGAGWLCFSADQAWGGSKDTVADVQAAATEAIPKIADVRQAIEDINALLQRLNTEPTFAQHFFKAANRNDQAALLGLIRQQATRTNATIKSLKAGNSFFLSLAFVTKKEKAFGLCISTDANIKCPNGKGFDIGVL